MGPPIITGGTQQAPARAVGEGEGRVSSWGGSTECAPPKGVKFKFLHTPYPGAMTLA